MPNENAGRKSAAGKNVVTHLQDTKSWLNLSLNPVDGCSGDARGPSEIDFRKRYNNVMTRKGAGSAQRTRRRNRKPKNKLLDQNAAALHEIARAFANHKNGAVSINNAGSVPRASRKRRGRKSKGARASVALTKAHPAAREFLRAAHVAKPNAAAKVPYNPLGVPTTTSMVCSTSGAGTYSITAAQYMHVGFFPGHGYTDVAAPLDLVSAHHFVQNIGGTNYVVGPAGDGTRNPCLGVIIPSSATTTLPSNSSTVGNIALAPINTLPFTAVDTNGHHTRWRMTALRIVMECVNPISTQGGTIQDVQPDSDDGSLPGNPIATGMRYGTYHTREMVGVKEIRWIPRPQDLYWWHSESGTAATDLSAIGIWITLAAPAANAVSVRLEWFANWEIAGYNVNQLSTPTVNSPAAQSHVLPALISARVLGAPEHMVNLADAHASVAIPDAESHAAGIHTAMDRVFGKDLAADVKQLTGVASLMSGLASQASHMFG